jgi:hypothetical protein
MLSSSVQLHVQRAGLSSTQGLQMDRSDLLRHLSIDQTRELCQCLQEAGSKSLRGGCVVWQQQLQEAAALPAGDVRAALGDLEKARTVGLVTACFALYRLQGRPASHRSASPCNIYMQITSRQV